MRRRDPVDVVASGQVAHPLRMPNQHSAVGSRVFRRMPLVVTGLVQN